MTSRGEGRGSSGTCMSGKGWSRRVEPGMYPYLTCPLSLPWLGCNMPPRQPLFFALEQPPYTSLLVTKNKQLTSSDRHQDQWQRYHWEQQQEQERWEREWRRLEGEAWEEREWARHNAFPIGRSRTPKNNCSRASIPPVVSPKSQRRLEAEAWEARELARHNAFPVGRSSFLKKDRNRAPAHENPEVVARHPVEELVRYHHPAPAAPQNALPQPQ